MFGDALIHQLMPGFVSQFVSKTKLFREENTQYFFLYLSIQHASNWIIHPLIENTMK